MRAAVLAAVLVASTVAHAEPPGLTPSRLTPPGMMPPGMTPPLTGTSPCPCMQLERKLRRPKERGAAILAAIAGSLSPWFIYEIGSREGDPNPWLKLAGVSAVLLPSAGHWYAEKLVTTGMALRLTGGAVSLVSLSMMNESESDGGGYAVLMSAGLITMIAGTFYDVATAGSEVDRWNRKHAFRLAPAITQTGDQYGVGVAGAF